MWQNCNAREWVEDCWHEGYDAGEARPDDGSAWTAHCSSAERMVRGGGWSNVPVALRTAKRVHLPPQTQYSHFGCRCVRSEPP